MNQHAVERKWWFAVPVSICTVLSVFGLFSAAGWDDSFIEPWSTSRALIFCASSFTILRFYSLILRLVVAWFEPASPQKEKAIP